MNDTVHALVTLPATDLNFVSVLQNASGDKIRSAINFMKASDGMHKTRLKACERELRKREREGKNHE